MSNEAWIGLASILVTLALGGATIVFGVVGWFLSRMIRGMEDSIREVRDEQKRHGERLTKLEAPHVYKMHNKGTA